jgi:DNA-binding response OmpR family regulator
VSITTARVLVVEDDDALRGMLEAAFSIDGFVVRTAADGPEAPASLRSRPQM